MLNRQDLSDIYLWFDTEFTTLELERAHLLQVALLPTDSQLNRIAAPKHDIDIVLRLDDSAEVSPWVEENLSKLLSRCRSPEALPISSLNSVISDWLKKNFGNMREDILKRPVLAGNSHACDWFLARRHIPRLIDFTSYRMLDVSAWKLHWKNSPERSEFTKEDPESIRTYLPFPLTGTAGKHDAYFDVQASIAEFSYYLHDLRENRGST